METIQITPQLTQIIGDMPHRFAMPLEQEIHRQLVERREAELTLERSRNRPGEVPAE